VRSDFELLDAWRAGDTRAGNELFRRHFDSVCRFFRNKVGDGVEDLIQKTFLACVRSRDAFRKQGSFRAYLFTIARHELYHHLKKRDREEKRIDPDADSVAHLGPGPSTVAARRAEQRILLDALRQLPLNLQIALELYYWEDMSAAELATVLELPEGTVRSRLRRARQLLEEKLRETKASASDIEATITGLEQWARSLREVVDESGANKPDSIPEE
jgi:RNA polymerase sigma-70 factor (ECF subfamily)